ncbi:MAG TPA: arylamine N-acetyltransferase [Terriglobales bacterium]|nr:arylamine N-acetyltransferase [Terriglobales bacterium]
MTKNPFTVYLRLLGFEAPPSGLDGLRQLIQAHLYRIPFENVSKLLLFAEEKRGRPIGIAEFLDNIQHHDLGGTCYTSNPFFAELLHECGYDAELLSADMNTPHVHSCIRVNLDGRAWHVDVGYASPFLEPVPLDSLPYAFERGNMRWVFERAADGRLACREFTAGNEVHGYRVNEERRDYEFFRNIITDSFQRGRTFMGLLRLVRIFPDRTVELKNRTMRIHRGTSSTEATLSSMEELREAVNNLFLIPRCPVEKAVAILREINGTDLFSE